MDVYAKIQLVTNFCFYFFYSTGLIVREEKETQEKRMQDKCMNVTFSPKNMKYYNLKLVKREAILEACVAQQVQLQLW